MHAYERKHSHPLNRLAHLFGVPAVTLSLLMLPFSRKLSAALFVGGWALQLAGHAVQGNQPGFLEHPRFLLVGPVWVAREWRNLMKPARSRVPPTR